MTPGTERPSSGFAPIEGRGARVLILGSLPGVASINAGQYYAHPRNAFWPIMGELVGARGSYDARCAALRRAAIAVWDVAAESVRPGSLDSDIRMDTVVVNDFAALFARQPGLELIGFNGGKAEQLFRRYVTLPKQIRTARLPSTSPAHAALTVADKLEVWRNMLSPTLNRETE